MNGFTVYCHTNKINGKKYFGLTSRSAKKRYGSTGCHYRGYFGNAIRKYGWDNFEHKKIAIGLSEQKAKQLEIHLIKEYSTANRLYGYNLTDGGEGTTGYKYTKEQNKKNSERSMGNTYSLGHKHTPEWKRNTSERMMGNAYALGSIHTAAQDKRRADTNRGKTRSGKALENLRAGSKKTMKPIIQLSLNGEVIKDYVSMTIAAKETGVWVSSISSCCSGSRKTAGGFKWAYSINKSYIRKETI